MLLLITYEISIFIQNEEYDYHFGFKKYLTSTLIGELMYRRPF